MTSIRAQSRYAALRDKGRREIRLKQPINPASAPISMRFNPALLALLVIFVTSQIIFDFHYHNANGWATLPNRMVRFENAPFSKIFVWVINFVILALIIKLVLS